MRSAARNCLRATVQAPCRSAASPARCRFPSVRGLDVLRSIFYRPSYKTGRAMLFDKGGTTTSLWSGAHEAIYLSGMTPQDPQLRQLGSNGPSVFPLGLGCMAM